MPGLALESAHPFTSALTNSALGAGQGDVVHHAIAVVVCLVADLFGRGEHLTLAAVDAITLGVARTRASVALANAFGSDRAGVAVHHLAGVAQAAIVHGAVAVLVEGSAAVIDHERLLVLYTGQDALRAQVVAAAADPEVAGVAHRAILGNVVVDRTIAVVVCVVAGFGHRSDLTLAGAKDAAEAQLLTSVAQANAAGLGGSGVAGLREQTTTIGFVRETVAVIVPAVAELGRGQSSDHAAGAQRTDDTAPLAHANTYGARGADGAVLVGLSVAIIVCSVTDLGRGRSRGARVGRVPVLATQLARGRAGAHAALRDRHFEVLIHEAIAVVVHVVAVGVILCHRVSGHTGVLHRALDAAGLTFGSAGADAAGGHAGLVVSRVAVAILVGLPVAIRVQPVAHVQGIGGLGAFAPQAHLSLADELPLCTDPVEVGVQARCPQLGVVLVHLTVAVVVRSVADLGAGIAVDAATDAAGVGLGHGHVGRFDVHVRLRGNIAVPGLDQGVDAGVHGRVGRTDVGHGSVLVHRTLIGVGGIGREIRVRVGAASAAVLVHRLGVRRRVRLRVRRRGENVSLRRAVALRSGGIGRGTRDASSRGTLFGAVAVLVGRAFRTLDGRRAAEHHHQHRQKHVSHADRHGLSLLSSFFRFVFSHSRPGKETLKRSLFLV